MRPWTWAAICLLAVATASRADDEIDRLVKQLRGDDVLAAQDAADALGRMGTGAEAAVPALADALRRAEVARPAALALAHMGDKGVAALMDVRNEEALTRAGRSAVPALAAELRADDPKQREWAADILASIGPVAADAVPALTEALDDRRLSFDLKFSPWGPEDGPAVWRSSDALESSRRRAARALAQIGPQGEAALVDAVQDWRFPPRWREALSLLEELHQDKVFTYSLKIWFDDPRRTLPQVPVILLQDLDELKPRLEALWRHDRRERWLAAEALAQRGHEPPIRALPALREMLQEPDADSRVAAADALKAYGPDAREAVPDLIQILSDPRYVWPGFGADPRIGAIGSLRGSWGVQDAATEALLAMGPEAEARLIREGVPRIATGLKDENELCRAHAAVALMLLGPRAGAAAPALAEAYLHTALDDWQPVSMALQSVGSASAPALLQLTRSGDADSIGSVLQMLGELGPDGQSTIPDLVKFARSTDSKVRAAAVGALAVIDPREKAARAALLAAARDADVEVRRAAVHGLARLDAPAPEALPPLRDLLADDDVGADAAYALLRLGDAPGAPSERLADLLRAKDPLARALTAFKRLGPRARDAAPALVRRLEDADPVVRVRAADALLAVAPDKARAARPVLRKVLEDPRQTEEVRRTAALVELDYDNHFGPDLTPDSAPDIKERVRRLIIELRAGTSLDFGGGPAKALGDIGKPAEAAIPFLKEDLKEASTRPWAAYALLRITGDDDTYLPMLIHDIASEESAAAALDALGPRGKPAIPALEEALNSPYDIIQANAADALGKMGPAAFSAVPRLIRLLPTGPSAEWFRRYSFAGFSAVEALGEIGPAAKDAVAALKVLANDDDDRIAGAAEKALDKIEASDHEP